MFVAIVAGTFWLLSMISSRNSQAEERLERIGRPKSLVEIEMAQTENKRAGSPGSRTRSRTSAARWSRRTNWRRTHSRSSWPMPGSAASKPPAYIAGIRVVCLVVFLLPALFFFLLKDGFTLKSIQWTVILGGIGFYLPQIVLWHLRTTRQKEIFLTLPDALDLLVVCVESGLGLDAALRKVTEEMKGHAKMICEEFSLANLQLQMGRPRREVLHDLGVRTGVDDVRSLAAILIQADRFGSSIAQALRVQSDSMRTRRRQMAEEKAAKTAVQLIFPLVLFIFPAIFVVLVGPAAIQIQKNLLKGS